MEKSYQKIAGGVAAFLGAAEGAILFSVLVGKVFLYDTLPFWMAAQAFALILLLICCVVEFRQQGREKRIMIVSYQLMLLAILLELLNTCMSWWLSGLLIKIFFILLFAFYLIKAIKTIPAGYMASKRAEKLSRELHNSRIILAMSQIRTHFIFNVLNAISGMCKYDPEKADDTVVRFARYLRSNIDIMQEDKPVTFQRVREHLEDYVTLEQVRFGDKIRFVTDMKTQEFTIPSLILQPIVENSIKHGLLPKQDGGTIWLRTKREKDDILICIEDDGVGFDPDKMRGNSIGLENVRFRLKHMMNGSIEIESSPGKGTRVEIKIPYIQGESDKEAKK
ncbi:MAG: histidine kinase [Lachnospiraceae bacterium]|nr:histidine kinase [Lachnospiraceae bacterium]